MSKEKTITIIGLGMLTGTAFYGAVAYFIWVSKVVEIPFIKAGVDKNIGIIFLILGFILVSIARPVKERLWKMRKASINSVESFFSSFFTCVIIELAILEAIAVLGLVLFLLTGNIMFPMLLIFISLVVQFIEFSARYNIEDKKREFSFKF